MKYVISDEMYTRSMLIQVVSEKIIQLLIAEKVNKARQQHTGGQKHNFPMRKKIFKCYYSMVKCKSYGPLSDEW